MEDEKMLAAEQLENLRASSPGDTKILIENEDEITHPPGERAILPFELLSPGDADYVVFIDRWLEREKKKKAVQ